jgi:hypothetical protein
MSKSDHNGHDHAEHDPDLDGAEPAVNEGLTTAVTLGVVAVGVALFEVALLPAVALGAVAALAPRWAPRLGQAVNPVVRSTVRGAVKIGRKTREMAAEAQEHLNDIVAEVNAEGDVVEAVQKPHASA